MKALFTLLLVIIATAGFAQQACDWGHRLPTYKNFFRDSSNIFSDTLLKKLVQERRNAISTQKQREELNRKLALARKNQRPIDNMPNAINLSTVLPPVYDGNNGQGFDIYRSQLDNMPIFIPDSANGASLKIKTDPKIQQSIPVQPKKLFLIPKN